MIRYDQQLRAVMSEKANLDPEMIAKEMGTTVEEVLRIQGKTAEAVPA